MKLEEFDPNGVGVNNGCYFGLPFDTETSELVIISAPWDVTVSYGSGASYAPDAINEASTQLDLYDEIADGEWLRGISTADVDYELMELSEKLRDEAEKVIEHVEGGGAPSDEKVARKVARINEGCRQMNQQIYAQAKGWIDKGKIVGLVGGDHSTPYGAIKALAEKESAFGILHIDAHCDLREAYEGFEFSHASIMYNTLRDVEQVRKIVQVGIRDCSSEEQQLAKESTRVELFTDYQLAAQRFEGQTWAEQCRRIVEHLPQKVYVSFDVDGLQMSYCPHTGTPVTGGLSFNEAIYLLNTLVESGRTIIGFDVVEVVPQPNERIDQIVGARILFKLCGLALKSNKKTK